MEDHNQHFAEFAFEAHHRRKQHGATPWATGGLGGVGLGSSYFPGSSPPVQTAQFGDGDNDADDHGGQPDNDNDGAAPTAGMGNAVSTAGGASS